jgi:KaiC/GvpD/RAD55 family RecA-like ATPase
MPDQNDLFSIFDKYEVSEEEANMIADPDWIIPNLVIRGHFIAIVAQPNGGKTTLFMHLSKVMTDLG